MGYQPHTAQPLFVDEDGRVIPPQGESRILSSIERIMIPQCDDPNKSSYVPPMWGVTAREAAEALMRLFGPWKSEPIGDSSDGIAPCGYEEISPDVFSP